MNGGIVSNIRRTGIPATKRGKPNPAYSEAVEGLPTNLRIARAGKDYAIGGDERTGKRYLMQDTPLERMRSRNAIGGMEYAALRKYGHHFYHAGHNPSLGSVDLDRIFSSDPSTRCGMAIGEKQVFHQQEIRKARELLGHRPGIIVDNVVCAEMTLDIAGYSIGWTNKPQAIAAATEMLREAGYRLAKMWNIG